MAVLPSLASLVSLMRYKLHINWALGNPLLLDGSYAFWYDLAQ